MTKYEKAIYEIVDNSRDHLTAEQVLAALREKFPAVSQATVYNNLKKLCEEGLIRKLSFPGTRDRYDRIADVWRTYHLRILPHHCGHSWEKTFCPTI